VTAPPTFSELIKQHPQILFPRQHLSFSSKNAPVEASEEWDRSGVVMLRGAISPATLARCRLSFQKFINATVKKKREERSPDHGSPLALDEAPKPEWDNGELDEGSWHLPWVVRHDGYSPTAAIMADLIGSWTWPFIEAICHSKDIVVMFGLCVARHNIDKELRVGVHQDATAVNPEVPLSIWIPLHDVVPKRQSGLGFVVPSPGRLLPALPHHDIGVDYFLDQLQMNNVWVPRYHAGDLTIHSRYSPHFTTGYGTQTDRYSLEIRLWAREESFVKKYYDPSIRISRRNGIPMITETRCSPGIGAHGFLASTAMLAMQATTSANDPIKTPDEAGPSIGTGNSLPRAVMGRLRDVARRIVPGNSH
jgi:hypothetical protein